MPRHVSSIYKVSPFPWQEMKLFFFSCKTFSHCVVQLIFYTSALCQTIYNNTWWSKCQGHSFKLFFHIKCIWSFFWHFFLTGIPHLIVGQTYTIVFLKLDAKILSKVSSLLLVDKEWSGGDLRELIYDRVLNAFFPTIHLGNEWLEEFLIDFILCSPPCWFCTYKITRTSYTSHWWTEFDTLETVLDTATNFGWFLATILDIFGHFWPLQDNLRMDTIQITFF